MTASCPAGLRVWPPPGGVVVILVLITAFRLWYCTQLELVGDEAYYWLWSKHLDYGYFSKGPGVAWTIALGTWLFGDTVFGIRFFAVLLAAGTSALIYILARTLFNETVAWGALLLGNLIPMFAVGSILMTIDPLSVFFWALAALFFWRAKDEDSVVWWMLTGAAIGLGSLCKYTNLAQIASFLIFCLWCPEYRRHFRKATLASMILVALVALTPVLLWNQQHDWITAQHLAHRGGLDRSWRFSLIEFSKFAGQQAGVISPLVFAGIVLAATQGCIKLFDFSLSSIGGRRGPGRGGRSLLDSTLLHPLPARSSQGEDGELDAALVATRGKSLKTEFLGRRYLQSLFWPLFGMYTIMSFNDAGQPNWTAPCYVGGIILVASQWRELIQRKAWARRLAVAALLLALAETVLLHNTFWLNLPPNRDPLNRVRGSEDLARQVAALQEKHGATFVIANKYANASLLAFYHPQRPETFIPRSATVDNQFSFWPSYHNKNQRKSAIYVSDSEELPPQFQTEFMAVERIQETYAMHRGRPVRKFYLTLCRELRAKSE